MGGWKENTICSRRGTKIVLEEFKQRVTTQAAKLRHCEERTTQFRDKKDCLNAIKKDCLRRTSDGMPVAEEC